MGNLCVSSGLLSMPLGYQANTISSPKSAIPLEVERVAKYIFIQTILRVFSSFLSDASTWESLYSAVCDLKACKDYFLLTMKINSALFYCVGLQIHKAV